jgi:amino acid adenylation domain-containing protein
VRCGDVALTYAQLRAQSGRLATHLQARGVVPDTLVAICIDRSVEMVVGLLGILRAGGAYLPIDPAFPRDRIELLLDDGAIRILVTRTATVLDPGLRRPERALEVLDLDRLLAAPARTPTDAAIASAATLDQLAYVIFTSGSTGQPKGVAMTHAPLVNLLQWQGHSSGVNRARAAAIDPVLAARPTHTLQFTPLTFDVSFLEIFSTLLSGGTVVIPTEHERRDVSALLDLIVRHEVASVFLPLIAMNQMAEAGVRRKVFPRSLVEIMTGGEQLRITPEIAAWFRGMPQCTLQNIYGPTEAHVVTTHELHGDPAGWPALPPIGRPIPNAEVHVLDAAMQRAAPGETGEIYVGGICLSRGYLHRPELTAERFLDNPLGPGRLYRTGDLAHYLPDGVIMYAGRVDDQVKIQGMRVELGEIETALEHHPDVRECAVVARADLSGAKRLVAYLVPRADPPAAPITRQMAPRYHEHLARQLPEHMVPRTYVIVAALPTTSSGKVDRKALPPPSTRRPELQSGYAAPTTELERTIVPIWREVLQLEEVGIDDSFFELGGGSLMLVQLQNRLSGELGRELPLVALFENPTIRALARHLAPPAALPAVDPREAERLARRSSFRRQRSIDE